MQYKDGPTKVLEKFEGSFQTPNIHGVITKKLTVFKQQDDETSEQFNILLTKDLKLGYPRDYLDNRKVQVLSNATKYFDIKYYIREQPLTPTCLALLDKCKINE